MNDLLNKEMSRPEFLKTIGFGLISLMGFSSILKFLGDKGYQHSQRSVGGYGSSSYGK